MKYVIAVALLFTLALAGCVANATSPRKCFACGGPLIEPFATPLQWPECVKWCGGVAK